MNYQKLRLGTCRDFPYVLNISVHWRVVPEAKSSSLFVVVAFAGRWRGVSIWNKKTDRITLWQKTTRSNFCMCSTLQCIEALCLQEITLWFCFWREGNLSNLSKNLVKTSQWQRATRSHGLSICVKHFNVLKHSICRRKQFCGFVAAFGRQRKCEWLIHETCQEFTYQTPALGNIFTGLVLQLKYTQQHKKHGKLKKNFECWNHLNGPK